MKVKHMPLLYAMIAGLDVFLLRLNISQFFTMKNMKDLVPHYKLWCIGFIVVFILLSWGAVENSSRVLIH